MSEIPADLRYSQDHLWVRRDSGTSLVRVGVTDFAQDSLGDVLEVTLPGLGDAVEAGEACGTIESAKSISDLIAFRHRDGARRKRRAGPQPRFRQLRPLRPGLDVRNRDGNLHPGSRAG